MTAVPSHEPPRTRQVTYTDLVLALLARVPAGLTSAQIGKEVSIAANNASAICQRLFLQGRITREVRFPPSGRVPQFCIWKAKTHA